MLFTPNVFTYRTIVNQLLLDNVSVNRSRIVKKIIVLIKNIVFFFAVLISTIRHFYFVMSLECLSFSRVISTFYLSELVRILTNEL